MATASTVMKAAMMRLLMMKATPTMTLLVPPACREFNIKQLSNTNATTKGWQHNPGSTAQKPAARPVHTHLQILLDLQACPPFRYMPAYETRLTEGTPHNVDGQLSHLPDD